MMLIDWWKRIILLLLVIDFCITININDNKYRNDINAKSFIFYKSNVFVERSCDCTMEISCSCCESVVMLYMQTTKRLCANFAYQSNNLNVNITLNSNTLRTATVKIYRPFSICSSIPGSIFSFVCLNILELNSFPQSISACPRLTIITKAQNWKLNYRCISIATAQSTVNDQAMNDQSLTNTSQSSDVAMKSQIILSTSIAPALIRPTNKKLNSLTVSNDEKQINTTTKSL